MKCFTEHYDDTSIEICHTISDGWRIGAPRYTSNRFQSKPKWCMPLASFNIDPCVRTIIWFVDIWHVRQLCLGKDDNWIINSFNSSNASPHCSCQFVLWVSLPKRSFSVSSENEESCKCKWYKWQMRLKLKEKAWQRV